MPGGEVTPRAGGLVARAEGVDRERPGDAEVRVVVPHGQILSRVVGPVDAVADVGDLAEHLEPVQEAARHVQHAELLVVEPEGLVPSVRRRTGPGVDEHVQDSTTGTADQLGLTCAAATVQAAQRPVARARLGLLHVRRGVEPVRRRNVGVEGAREESALVAARPGRKSSTSLSSAVSTRI